MGLKLLALLGILAVLGHTVSGPPIASSSNIAAQKQPKFLVSKSGFTEGRLKVLKGIISNGGSVQSYDVFTYEEYTIIGQLDRKTAKPFQRSARLLKKNISQLVGRHPDIAKNSTLNGIDDTLKREVKGKKISGPIHAMVMDCKNFMRNLLSEGGEGSWLDVFTFIHSEDPKKEDEWRHLETIHELSKIQSPTLDKLTNRLLLKEHLKNKPKGIGLHRAVIEGAGPIGQFAAIRLFVSGFDIMLFNDRDENYVRNQIVLLDTKWTVQLRFYLGTIYDKLFKDDVIGRQFEESGFQSQAGVGANEFKVYQTQVNTSVFENALKDRLTNLADYVYERTKTHHLQIGYKTKVVTMEFPSPRDRNFYVAIEGEKLPPKKQRYKTKVVKGQVYKEFAAVKLLVCAGGKKDSVRDQLLGIPIEETIPKSFGVSVFHKGKKYFGTLFLPPANIWRNFVKLRAMKPFLEAQNLDALLRDSDFVPLKVRKRYAKLTEMMVQGIETLNENDRSREKPVVEEGSGEDSKLKLKPESQDQKIELRLFENKRTLYIGAETPLALAALLGELKEFGEKNTKIKEGIDMLKTRLTRKWFAALAYKTIGDTHPDVTKIPGLINVTSDGDRGTDDDKLISFDPEKVNSTIFDVIQRALTNGAHLFEKYGRKAFVIAFGDSRVSPHFFSRSGLTSGRIGIEKAAKAFMLYHRDLIQTDILMKRINTDKVQKDALQRGSFFVKPRRGPRRLEIYRGQMFEILKDLFGKKRNPPKHEYDYQLQYAGNEKFSLEKPIFNVKLINGTLYSARISVRGTILVDSVFKRGRRKSKLPEGTKQEFQTMEQLVFYLFK